MFAVIKTGGKQYKVAAGDILKIEKVVEKADSVINFSDLLMLHDGKELKIGNPLVANSCVKATILEQKRDNKVIIFKKKRRQGYDRKTGHRQYISIIHIDEIVHNDNSLVKCEYKRKISSQADDISNSVTLDDQNAQKIVKSVESVEPSKAAKTVKSVESVKSVKPTKSVKMDKIEDLNKEQ